MDPNWSFSIQRDGSCVKPVQYKTDAQCSEDGEVSGEECEDIEEEVEDAAEDSTGNKRKRVRPSKAGKAAKKRKEGESQGSGWLSQRRGNSRGPHRAMLHERWYVFFLFHRWAAVFLRPNYSKLVMMVVMLL